MKTFEYFINLNERGEFYADIRNTAGHSVIEIDTEYAQFLSYEGVNLHDVESIRRYFVELGDILPSETLGKGQ